VVNNTYIYSAYTVLNIAGLDVLDDDESEARNAAAVAAAAAVVAALALSISVAYCWADTVGDQTFLIVS